MGDNDVDMLLRGRKCALAPVAVHSLLSLVTFRHWTWCLFSDHVVTRFCTNLMRLGCRAGSCRRRWWLSCRGRFEMHRLCVWGSQGEGGGGPVAGARGCREGEEAVRSHSRLARPCRR